MQARSGATIGLLLALALAGCLEATPPPAALTGWTIELRPSEVAYDPRTDGLPPVVVVNATWHGPGGTRVPICSEGPLLFVVVNGEERRLDWHAICKAYGDRDVPEGFSIESRWTFDGTYRVSPSGYTASLAPGEYRLVARWANATAEGRATLHASAEKGLVVSISPSEATFTGSELSFLVRVVNEGDSAVTHPICTVEPTLRVVRGNETWPIQPEVTCAAYGNTTLAPGEAIQREYRFDGHAMNPRTFEQEKLPSGEYVLEARFLDAVAQGKLVVK